MTANPRRPGEAAVRQGCDSVIGSLLGRHRVLEEIGCGGMGRVYRCVVEGAGAGPAEGTLVAVKVVHPHLAATDGYFRRFAREGDIGLAVRHPNVVRTYSVETVSHDGAEIHTIVMEHVEGQTLRQLLDEIGTVPEQLCRHIGRELALGLGAIHAIGAVHRDVKPENVLITPESVVKLMDLGVARLADEAMRLSRTGEFVGSVRYASPEQFALGARPVDSRADLHGLGLVLYELATAKHPFEAADFPTAMRRVLDEPARRCSEHNPQISPFFEEVLHGLLAKDPAARLGPAENVAEILGAGEDSTWWGQRATAIREGTRRPLRRMRVPRETQLYGRAAEIGTLRSAWERARRGDGAVVLVEGEPGIGKSRLVDEFVASLLRDGEDLNFLHGSYPPGGAATSSGAFATAYREQFGEEGLESRLASYMAITPSLIPAFASLLRGEGTPVGVEPLTKESLQTVFAHATRGLAAERPTVVLIDDLHFAPEEGRALFAALATAVPGHRVLLVGATRPGADEKWTLNVERIGAVRIAVQRLGVQDLAALLTETLKSQRLAEDLVGRVGLKSDGNPFFVFEILRSLRDAGLIAQRADGSWGTTQIIRDIEIPSSIREMFQARVADLDEEDRNILEVGACIGFAFDPLLVGIVLDIPQIPLMRRLAQIERKSRLVHSVGRRFEFDHHQVQEALYAGMPELLREPYHAALADALVRLHRADAKDPASLDGSLALQLTEHLLASRQGAPAARYVGAALTWLEGACQQEAAAALADRALHLPDGLTGEARLDVLLRRADALDAMGRRDEQSATLDEALVVAEGLPSERRRGEVLCQQGRLRWNMGRSADALPILRTAVALAVSAADPRGEFTARLNLGHATSDAGDPAAARREFERCLEIAQRTGDSLLEAKALGTLALALSQEGRLDEALRCSERDAELHRLAGARRSHAIALGILGTSLAHVGRTSEARARHEECLTIARELGDRRTELIATNHLAGLDMAEGDALRARSRFERVVDLAEEIRHLRGETAALGGLSLVEVHVGRYDVALTIRERLIALARERGDRFGEGWSRSQRAAILLLLGDAAEAWDDAVAGWGILRDLGHRRAECDALFVCGDCLAARGDGVGAASRWAEAHTIRAEIGYAEGAIDVTQRQALALIDAGDMEGACPLLEACLATPQSPETRRVRTIAAALRACAVRNDAATLAACEAWAQSEPFLAVHERVLVLRSLWHATGDPAHLTRATQLVRETVSGLAPERRERALSGNLLFRSVRDAAVALGGAP